jgi:hypothetical protein
MSLVNQRSALPTRKLTAAIVALAAVKAGFAVGNYYGWGWMVLPELNNAAEIVIPFVAGYWTKDRSNA